MAKYAPLAKFLSEIPSNQNTVPMHFSEIEKVIHLKLPPAARKYHAWWSNEKNGVHVAGIAWQRAGWKSSKVNLKNETVVFIRKRVPNKIDSAAWIMTKNESAPIAVSKERSKSSKIHSHRSTASFGKRQEYIIVAELLRLGFDVYMTLVDDQQIDCIVRLDYDGQPKYLDIQIKARSMDCEPRNSGRFAVLDIPNPREGYFYIFYSEQAKTTWVIPSLDLVKLAQRNKTGKNAGKYSVNLCNSYSTGVKPRPKFREYEFAFDLLK